MLTTLLQPGVLLIGLAKLINTPKPAFEGHYRKVNIGALEVLEFFEGVASGPGMLPVKILPYAPGAMNTVTAGSIEVISGEFTGCVMSLFKQGGALKCAHVDTNPDTTQRAAYDALKKQSGVEVVAEYDTTGKLQAYPMLTGATRILCVASGNAIVHYYADRELHQFGVTKDKAATNETRYKILHSHGA